VIFLKGNDFVTRVVVCEFSGSNFGSACVKKGSTDILDSINWTIKFVRILIPILYQKDSE
jgi:hypothetical protein